MVGMYQFRYRDVSVYYSGSEPIAFQVGNDLPVIKHNKDPGLRKHYDKLMMLKRYAVPAYIFDEQFNSLMERRWEWGNDGSSDAL